MNNYIYILDCNSDIGSCCSDPGMVSIIDIVRRLMDLFQLIVPIVLLTMLTFQLIKLVMNPEEKNGISKIKNRIIAAVLVFIVPVFINIVMSNIPESEDFQIAACWNSARDMAEMQRTSSGTYNSKYDGHRINLLAQKPVEQKKTAGNGNEKGQTIVNYAMKFVGQPYKYGGSWNGSIPYTPTDCSGFVQGVYSHYGINLLRTTSSIWADSSKYTLITNDRDIRAGDLAMYDGHVAIFTGNDGQIVHACNTQRGIVVDSDYTKAASGFKGILRIKGVY